MKPFKKIAFLTMDKVGVKTWSGTPHFMSEGLKHIAETVEMVHVDHPLITLFAKLAFRILRMIKGGTVTLTCIPFYRKMIQSRAKRWLQHTDADLVIACACSPLGCHFDLHPRVIYTSDATFDLMNKHYNSFSSLIPACKQRLAHDEALSIAKAWKVVMPSQWAVDSCVKAYHRTDDVHYVPYGANMDTELATESPDITTSSPIHVMFVGVDWARKGGQKTLEVFSELLNTKDGRTYHLTIVGCNPTIPEQLKKYCTVIPFLDKSQPEQLKQLHELYKQSYVFLMPTLQEAYGIVFAEASHFGVPILTHHVGGVGGVVQDGVNGYKLPLDAHPAAFAAKIQQWLDNPDEYKRLRGSAQSWAKQRLTWQAFAEAIYEMAREDQHISQSEQN